MRSRQKTQTIDMIFSIFYCGCKQPNLSTFFRRANIRIKSEYAKMAVKFMLTLSDLLKLCYLRAVKFQKIITKKL